MKTQSTHILSEYHGCPPSLLDDLEYVEAALQRAAIAAGATIVRSAFHRYAPQGVSGVVVVEESHLSIHTWPEAGYAAVDVFTCGDCRPAAASALLAGALRATRVETMSIARGQTGERSIQVRQHQVRDASTSESARPLA